MAYRKFTAEEKKEYAKKKQAETKETFKLIEEGLLAFDADKYRRYLGFMTQFHNYSPNNIWLIMVQSMIRKTNVTHLASSRQWRKMGRKVQDDQYEHGYTVITPRPKKYKVELKDGTEEERTRMFFGVGNTYDISQTDKVKDDGFEPAATIGETSTSWDNLVTKFKRVAQGYGYSVKQDTEGYIGGAFAAVDHANRVLYWRDMASSDVANSMAHELGHIVSRKNGYELNKQQEELLAESVAYVLLQRLGFEESTQANFEYIMSWADDGIKTIKALLTNIRDASNELFEEVQGV